MPINLKDHPEVERAIELSTDPSKLYLITLKPTVPRRLAEDFGAYLKKLGVNAVVLALDEVRIYDVERIQADQRCGDGCQGCEQCQSTASEDRVADGTCPTCGRFNEECEC